MEWNSYWIWDNSGLHPRNYWLCFRKTFHMKNLYDQASIHITADSKYILFVNGRRVGFGPVRCWDFEYSYDTYDIKDYLVCGKNTVAVLVIHHGVSTFQYVEGEAGLLAQIELGKNNVVERTIKSDRTWKAARHEGYEQYTSKISAQQAWVEVFDANRFNDSWFKPYFNDSLWGKAVVVKRQSSKEGRCLIERDIPYLSCQKIYAKRVCSYKEVQTIHNAISINLRDNIFLNSFDANKRKFAAYIILKIMCPHNVKGKLTFPFSQWQSPRGTFKINNKIYVFDNTQRQVDIEMVRGENEFIMDVSGMYHEYSVRMAFDVPVQLEFMQIGNSMPGRCIMVGPFYTNQIQDVECEEKAISLLSSGDMDSIQLSFNQSRESVDIEALKAYKALQDMKSFNIGKIMRVFNNYLSPIPEHNIYINDAYSTSTMKKVVRTIEEGSIVDNSCSGFNTRISNFIVPNENYSTVMPSFQGGGTEIIIDFGKELSGFIEFSLEAAERTQIDLYFFEYMNNGVIEHTSDLDNTLRYYTKTGRQSYYSHIRRGYRYVMLTITNNTKPIKLYSISTELCTYPVTQNGAFYSSDYQLNKIWSISAHTTQLCMEDTYVDCPAYEQTFWTGDSRNEALVNYYAFGEYQISKRCLNLIEKSSKITPFLMDQVPSGWQSVIPDWTFFWVIACKEYYQYTKDKEFLRDIFPGVLKVIKAYSKLINNDGLLEFTGWNLLDWADMDTPDSGVITHENAAFVKALEDTEYMAEELKSHEEVCHLGEMRRSVITAINKHLWNDQCKAYIDCIHSDGRASTTISQQTNIMVYLYDCYDQSRKQHIENIILHPEEIGAYIQNNIFKEVKIGSPFMSFFLLEALVKIKDFRGAINYIRNNWGQMLEMGATTCWEMFPGFMPDRLTRSHCHAWSAAPVYFLGMLVLGITPLSKGLESILFSPKPCGLKWANGSVPTPYGTIDINWRIKDKIMDIFLSKPENIQCEIEIDKIQFDIEEVWLNKQRIM